MYIKKVHEKYFVDSAIMLSLGYFKRSFIIEKYQELSSLNDMIKLYMNFLQFLSNISIHIPLSFKFQ